MIISNKTRNITAECGGCFTKEQWLVHQVRLRNQYFNLCTSCVLKLHSGSFCPICFQVYEEEPPSDRVLCLRCPSIAHSCCVTSDHSTYVCPPCLNPNFVFIDTKRDDAGFVRNRFVDLKRAKVIVAAAKISSVSMSEAAAKARQEAERRVKEAALARKRAREALVKVASFGWKRKERKEEDVGAVVVRTVPPVPRFGESNAVSGVGQKKIEGKMQIGNQSLGQIDCGVKRIEGFEGRKQIVNVKDCGQKQTEGVNQFEGKQQIGNQNLGQKDCGQKQIEGANQFEGRKHIGNQILGQPSGQKQIESVNKFSVTKGYKLGPEKKNELLLSENDFRMREFGLNLSVIGLREPRSIGGGGVQVPCVKQEPYKGVAVKRDGCISGVLVESKDKLRKSVSFVEHHLHQKSVAVKEKNGVQGEKERKLCSVGPASVARLQHSQHSPASVPHSQHSQHSPASVPPLQHSQHGHVNEDFGTSKGCRDSEIYPPVSGSKQDEGVTEFNEGVLMGGGSLNAGS